MPPPAEPRFLRALRREPVDRTPVWMMRQAGRYLPEYRATRARAGAFMNLVRTPELACEVTLQPLARFPLDAAILFSDILTIPDAMGLGLSFVEGEGPQFSAPLRTSDDIRRLGVPDPETELRYVLDAVRTIRKALPPQTPLIGFSGSPWTLATYMVEGRGGHEFQRIKRLAYDEPQALDTLLAKLVQAVSLYLEAQAAAGAQALMMFDTWGGVLAPDAFRRASLEPMRTIVQRVKQRHPQVPLILFTKNGGAHLETLAATGCDALGCDWTLELGAARRRVGDRVALQGNLDPCILLAQPERIRQEVGRVLASYGPGPGHVFNLGHGILPETPPDHAAAMIEAVHQESAAFHR
ncbi:MAG TPA: uroporphyrinogen decarboxylase [Candidatus Binatia bacterium]|nr:uroporphyrinogen decarboxylase [Candidatus Binatia bacterium]